MDQYETATQQVIQLGASDVGVGLNLEMAMGSLIPVNSLDPAADLLADRIGGVSRVRFANDPAQREFDAVSSKLIGQTKPENFTLCEKWRRQAKATFEMAKATGRGTYFHFEGAPGPGVIEAIERYQARYNVPTTIDTRPW